MARQVYIQKQRFTLSGEKNVELEFEIDEETVTFFNERGKTDFMFKNANTRQVLDYWREVLKCMDLACQFAISQLDSNRIVNLSSKHPKGPGNTKTQRVRRGRKAKAQ